jgi:hypothetical protein
MAQFHPCPRCQQPIEIPQPPPEQIRCAGCGVAILLKRAGDVSQALAAGHPPPSAPTPTVAVAPVTPPHDPTVRNAAIVFGVIGAFMLLTCLGLVGAAIGSWLLGGNQTRPIDKPAPPAEAAADKKPAEPEEPPPPPDPRIKIVQPSVDKGVAFLRSQVGQIAGMRGGYLGLNGFTLLECDVPPDDPDVLRIAEAIRKGAPAMNQVYDLAACLFFLNRWDADRRLSEQDRKMARSFALRIIAGQMQTGIWGYGGVVLSPDQETKLLASLGKNGNYKPTGAGVVSMSNTQFAMLAVWGARKHGVPVREPLLALAAYFHANQQADGKWNYPGHSLTATSTCAALISLAIEKALLRDKEFADAHRKIDAGKKRADVNKGFEFVAKTIGRKKDDPNPGRNFGYGGNLFDADAIGDLYFLWTLERVGVIYSKDLIGGKNWYDWGFPIVMKAQAPNGSWNEKHGPLIDTPFALLFLKRANIARDLTRMIRGIPED